MNKRPLLTNLVRLVERYGVDVAMLAECPLDSVDVLRQLNSTTGSAFHDNKGRCEKITIYSTFRPTEIRPVLEDHRMSIRRLELSAGRDLLLAVVHLQSKLHQSTGSQAISITEVARAIERAERRARHTRTVLVGDLNMHPFEDGVVGAAGLHAVMDKRVASKGQRVVEGREYAFFYNPMWSLLGDASSGPPGTFYQSRSEQVAYFWHMFDQVLIRPELLTAFDNTELRILTTDGTSSFLTSSGTPDESVASDHLPILFSLRG